MNGFKRDDNRSQGHGEKTYGNNTIWLIIILQQSPQNGDLKLFLYYHQIFSSRLNRIIMCVLAVIGCKSSHSYWL